MFAITQDDAQTISRIAMVVFGLTLILVPVAILTEWSRAAMRRMVLVGLSFALLMGFASGYLYLWHHYYR